MANKNKKHHNEVPIYKWEDLLDNRNGVQEKIDSAIQTVMAILGSLRSKEDKINKEHQAELKELDNILSGFTKSIGDIGEDLEKITLEHATKVVKGKDEDGDEIYGYDFKHGVIDKDDVASFIKYNQIVHNYITLENMAYELYSKTVPDIFLRAGQLLEDDNFVKQVEKVKSEIDNYQKQVESAFGRPEDLLNALNPNNITDEEKDVEIITDVVKK